MVTMTITQAREDFATLFNRVAFGHERIVIGRRGKDSVALVPVEDMEYMEQLEDQNDIEAADAALAESDERINYKEIRQELGL